MRRATMQETKTLAEQEMVIFDSLHPCIRKVVSEHSAGIYLLGVFQKSPQLYAFALENPRDFMYRVKTLLDRLDREASERLHKEITEFAEGFKP